MAVSIAGVLWQLVRVIRECRRRCLPGGARVCYRAATLKYLASANDQDVFLILVILLTLSGRIFRFTSMSIMLACFALFLPGLPSWVVAVALVSGYGKF